MNNKDTFDILHGEFDDCPQMPDSLSKRNIVAKLKDVSPEKKSAVSFKKLGSLAAAMIIVVVCAIVATTDFREDLAIEIGDIVATAPLTQSAIAPSYNNQTIPDGETALLRANSREEIVEMFLNSYKENENRYVYLFGYGADMDDYKGADGVTATPGTNGTVNESYNDAASGSAVDHAQTNTQTQGVDEGDIIKTDSRYIYFVGSDGSGNKKLKIIDTLTMTAVYNRYLYDENGDIMWVSDIYIKDNILVAVCAEKADYYAYSGGAMIDAVYPSSANTVIVSYDITDRANPKLIRREAQDGSYSSSRLIGNTLYTVSQYYVRAESEETIENVCIPKVSGAEISCDCIYMPENMGDSYICLTALDITDKNGRISALAVLGSTENYYCSQDTFYIIADEHNYAAERVEVRDKTVINSFSLDGLNISYKATGEVKGSTARSQYSLDEYENNLRVATTYYNYNTQKNESSLYVLDENLDVIGKLEDIANNEQIKSVRYMGKKAYVVTFRNTDPLFAIDLSDPKNPTILGELKLPGYSAYLHPIGENLLLGIGYDGDEDNADFNSVKISLFDISDPVNLKELDNIILNDKNVSTPVNNNPKALIYKADEGIIGFPVETYDYNISEQIEYGYYIIKVQNGKLQIMHKLIHEDRGFVDIYSFRGTYIGDKFFTVSDYSVKKFDFATGKEIAQWNNSEGVNLVPTTAVAEKKDIDDSPKTTVTATTQASTSQGYTVEEPKTTINSGVTGQTTPPYNPNNPREVTEMPTE